MRRLDRPESLRVFRRVAAALVCVLLSTPLCPPSFAEEQPDAARLKSLERNARETAAARDRVNAETADVAHDLDAVRTELIATAGDIQDQERSLTLMENHIADMERDTARMTQALAARDQQMGAVLLALERLALHPGDALALNPLSPDNAVRSAILLRAAIPQIKQSEATLQRDLAELYRLRTATRAQREAAAAAAATLASKRMRLESLEQEKSTRQAALVTRGSDLDKQVAKIAQEAQDLRELFARLAEEKARREKDAQKTALPPTPAPSPSQASPAPAAPATAENHDATVTRSFAGARGTMPFPVAGTLTGKYGEATRSSEDSSLRAKGITITTRSGAQVVAPFDGIVAFAGPFRGYGQLLIIEHSEGYHTLLAGLGRIDAAVGQHVLAGEPVGVMENEGAPSLYVELRRDGQPINPLPWLADRGGKNSG